MSVVQNFHKPQAGRFVALRERTLGGNFSQVANDWARDGRLTGNAIQMFVYINSHDQGFKITRAQFCKHFGYGKQKFLNAIKCLEDNGYLRKTEHRKANGHFEGFTYELQLPSDRPETQPWTKISHGEDQPVDNVQAESHGSVVDGSDLGDLGDIAPEALPQWAKQPTVEREAINRSPVNPPLKEDQLKEKETSSSSFEGGSTSGTNTKGIPRADDDDDPFSEFIDSESMVSPDDDSDTRLNLLLAKVHPELNIVNLRKTILTELLSYPNRSNLLRACTQILDRASGGVADPNAFVAKSVNRDPSEFFSDRETVAELSSHARPIPGKRWDCLREGHKTDYNNPWRTCFICDHTVLSTKWKCDVDGHFRHQVSEEACPGCGQDMNVDFLPPHEPGDF